MIAANEAVAELLSSRRREALYRVHERPDPQAVELLVAKLADLGVPTPPAPEHLDPVSAARVAAATSERVMDYVRRSKRGREAFPALILRSAIPASRPRRTATSRRRFAAIPISSSTASSCGSWERRTTRRPLI